MSLPKQQNILTHHDANPPAFCKNAQKQPQQIIQLHSENLSSPSVQSNGVLTSALSYHQLKLANFIQLELTDLKDTVNQLQESNIVNSIKQNISRAYNAFHELQKLFTDLGIKFLYEQTKKLIQSYGIMFVHLFSKIDRMESINNHLTNANFSMKNQGSIQEKSKRDVLAEKKLMKSRRKNNFEKLEGVCLYKETYARNMDYDMEQLRILREKAKNNFESNEEKQRNKKQEEENLIKSINQELNDYSYLTVDNENITEFLARQRQVNDQIRSMSLGDELQRIAKYFKESENQALEFLRKSKNTQFFHEISQGFHAIVEEYTQSKNRQTEVIKKKFEQILELFQKRSVESENIILGLTLEIQKLTEDLKGKRVYTSTIQVQTFHNFDEEIRQLFSRIVQQDMVIEQMKRYIKKSVDNESKERETLLSQIQMREGYLKQYKELLADKMNYSSRLQRKIKLIQESNKNKNIVDPIKYFDSLDKEIQKALVEELRERGIISHQSKHNQPHIRVTKTKASINFDAKNLDNSKHEVLENKIIETLLKRNQSKKKIRGSYNIKSQKQREKEKELLETFPKKENQFKEFSQMLMPSPSPSHLQSPSRKIIFNVDDIKFGTQSSFSKKNQDSKRNASPEQSKKSSRRVIKIRVQDRRDQQKTPRVFDVTDRSNFSYSQSYIELQDGTIVKNKYKNFRQGNERTISIRQSQSEQKLTYYGNDNGRLEQQAKIKDYRTQQDLIYEEEPKKLEQRSRKTIENKKEWNKKKMDKEQIQNQKQIKNQINVKKYEGKEKEKKRQQQNPNKDRVEKLNKGKKNHQNEGEEKKQSGNRKYSAKKINFQDLGHNQSSKKQITPEVFHQYSPYEQDIEENYKQKEIEPVIHQIFHQFTLSFQGGFSQQRASIKQNSVSNKLMNKTQSTKMATLSSLHNKTVKGAQKTKFSVTKEHSPEQITRTEKFILRDKQQKIVREISQQKKDKKYRTMAEHLTVNSLKKQQSKISGRLKKQVKSSLALEKKQGTKITQFRSLKNSIHKENTGSRENYLYERQNILVNQSQMVRQFEDQQIISAARQSKTVEQFQKRVAKVHYSKCGKNCRHLKRYVEGFLKLQKNNLNRKSTMKLHVQNMNNKFEPQPESKFNQLPLLTKK